MPIFYSAILLTGVNLLLRLVGTSFQVYISGRIGAAGVGLLQLVLSIGGMAMTAGVAGVRTATMYLTAEELGKKRPGNVHWVLQGCGIYSIMCSSIVGLAVYLAAPYLSINWIGDNRTEGALQLLALFLPITCLCGVMTGYFTAANRIGTLAVVEVAEQLCSMIFTLGALTLWAGQDPGRSCTTVVLGSCMGACLTFLCLVILRLREKTLPSTRIPVTRRLLDTAIPLALADDMKAGINTVENLMVPKRLSLYSGTDNALALFGTVSGMVFPVLMFPAAILFGLAELCIALYNNTDAGRYLKWFSLMVPMLYCDAITDAMVKGLGQQKASVRYNILTSTLDVIFLYLLLPRYGIGGYFASFLITHLINFVLSIRRLMKITGQSLPLLTPALCLASVTAGIALAAPVSHPIGKIGAFLAVLFSLLTLFRIVSKADVQWLKSLIYKK